MVSRTVIKTVGVYLLVGASFPFLFEQATVINTVVIYTNLVIIVLLIYFVVLYLQSDNPRIMNLDLSDYSLKNYPYINVLRHPFLKPIKS